MQNIGTLFLALEFCEIRIIIFIYLIYIEIMLSNTPCIVNNINKLMKCTLKYIRINVLSDLFNKVLTMFGLYIM